MTNSDPLFCQLNSHLSGSQLTLSDYLAAVKMTLQDIFTHDVWVLAEIRALSTKGGHYYLELADKDESGTINASCRATLWRFAAARVLDKFTQQTGMVLATGLKVLLRGRAVFHTLYGFSFNIVDINPSYTIGELAKAYQAMLEKLHKNGLLLRNKSLSMPFDLQKIAVIAPENAAGLGDFQAEADKLASAGACDFCYYYATFQGNHAVKEISAAITQAAADLPDILVIIRGGGAVGDLSYLNDYQLAAALAAFPVPVWVGIGHQRDRTILDEVAHRSFDTPSKAAAAITQTLVTLWQQANANFLFIQKSSTAIASAAKKNHQIHMQSLYFHTSAKLSEYKNQINHCHYALKTASLTLLHGYRQQLRHHLRNHKIAYRHLSFAKKQLAHWQDRILSYHPQQRLKQGYVLVRKDNQPIPAAALLQAGDTVQLQFFDSTVSATIAAS